MPRKLRSGTSEAYQPGLVEQTRDLLAGPDVIGHARGHRRGPRIRVREAGAITFTGAGGLHPVILGDGLRLFADRGPTHHLELLESRSLPSGVTIQTYRPAGRASLGDVGEERTARR